MHALSVSGHANMLCSCQQACCTSLPDTPVWVCCVTLLPSVLAQLVQSALLQYAYDQANAVERTAAQVT